ncbi:hypothetical protein AB1Y20_004267 [Prymnesium parvum]|uniref:Uncharacterized protein n=1 Tax=Prymnesium parvum TaxID=97485 RepID=A0AB34J9F9_PRYPA
MSTTLTAEEEEAKRLFLQQFLETQIKFKGGSIIPSEIEYNLIAATLEGWEDLDPADRGMRNKDVGGNRAYKWAQRFVTKVEHTDTTDAPAAVKLVLLEKTKAGTAEDRATEGADGVMALDNRYKVVLHEGNMFEELLQVHKEGGHCKSRTLDNRVKEKFSRIPRWVGELLCECCATCVSRSTRKAVTAGHVPILTKGLGSRGQVDLVDLQSCPDGEYKYLLNYQDHGLKLYENRPLTSKRAGAIAFALLDILSYSL